MQDNQKTLGNFRLILLPCLFYCSSDPAMLQLFIFRVNASVTDIQRQNHLWDVE